MKGRPFCDLLRGVCIGGGIDAPSSGRDRGVVNSVKWLSQASEHPLLQPPLFRPLNPYTAPPCFASRSLPITGRILISIKIDAPERQHLVALSHAQRPLLVGFARSGTCGTTTTGRREPWQQRPPSAFTITGPYAQCRRSAAQRRRWQQGRVEKREHRWYPGKDGGGDGSASGGGSREGAVVGGG